MPHYNVTTLERSSHGCDVQVSPNFWPFVLYIFIAYLHNNMLAFRKRCKKMRTTFRSLQAHKYSMISYLPLGLNTHMLCLDTMCTTQQAKPSHDICLLCNYVISQDFIYAYICMLDGCHTSYRPLECSFCTSSETNVV